MDDLRAKRCLISELPENDKPVKTVSMKPYTSIAVCIIFSIVMIITNFIPIAGWIIIAIAIVVSIKIPNYKIMDAYQDYFVIYQRNDNTYCQLVHWNEVLEWAFKQGKGAGSDMIVVKIKGEEITEDEEGSEDYVFIPCFNSIQMVHCFNKFVPELEAGKKVMAKMKNSPFHLFKKKGN